jgi:hypothetical protein
LPRTLTSMNLPDWPLASAVFDQIALGEQRRQRACMLVSSLSSPRRKLDANTWPASKYATSAPRICCCSRAAFDVNEYATTTAPITLGCPAASTCSVSSTEPRPTRITPLPG